MQLATITDRGLSIKRETKKTTVFEMPKVLSRRQFAKANGLEVADASTVKLWKADCASKQATIEHFRTEARRRGFQDTNMQLSLCKETGELVKLSTVMTEPKDTAPSKKQAERAAEAEAKLAEAEAKLAAAEAKLAALQQAAQ